MKKSIWIAILLLLCSLAGCVQPAAPAGSDTASTPATSGVYQPPAAADANDGIIDVDLEPLPCSQEALYSQLFDPANQIEIHVDIPPQELAKLQSDFEKNQKSPIYRQADLTITITTGEGSTVYRIRDVGVRMKGNTSRVNFYSPQEGIYNAIHLKIDLQETFDDAECYGSEARVWASQEERQARKNRTFAAMEKLELRWNKCYDSTYLKEGYAYELYRAYDVLAPLTNLCSLDMSGVHMGVYTLNEPVDKLFLEKRLPQEDLGGDLYKLGWTYTGASFTKAESIGVEDELNNEFYTYDLKTNKKTSGHEALKNLIAGLNSGNVTKESYAALVDTDYFLRYAAVSYFLGNPDDLRNNYNNCYLYFLQSSGKAILIPYDYDRCLGVTYEWNPTGDGLTRDDPFADVRYGLDNGPAPQENPLFIYSVDRGGFYVEEFSRILQQVAESKLLQPETFEARFQQAKALYGAYTQPGKHLLNGNGRDWQFALEGKENLSFADYISAKTATFRSYMEKLDDYLHYEKPQPATHYIRGDFNDWSSQEAWAMKHEDGCLYYTLTFSDPFRFKVYEEATGSWYGVEALPEDCAVEYWTDHHGNINLAPGTYRVCFDPVSAAVSLEKILP